MKTESTLDFFSLMLEEAARNPNLDESMTGQGDKRREEGANPAPPKPKAKIAKPKREASPEEPSNTGARAEHLQINHKQKQKHHQQNLKHHPKKKINQKSQKPKQNQLKKIYHTKKQ